MEHIDEVEESIEVSSTSVCRKTSKVYLADSTAGTSNLKRHRAKRHSHLSELGRYPVVNNEMFHELMAKATVTHNLPFAFVEYEGIREILSFWNPTVKTISRNTSKVDVLNIRSKKK
ncbi:uncharacterized protein LOC132031339 [Lycium ferocissimum]|uniref:uncharacterized protein LOC132031339 n=1 Tax=Lycium ferocissimum TaxID=112874 RepID=UPI002816660E|nr:uncharacterized protein LOC132031339 [Lycium ferocissimum]